MDSLFNKLIFRWEQNGYTGWLSFKCALTPFEVHLSKNKDVMKQNLNTCCYNYTEKIEFVMRHRISPSVNNGHKLGNLTFPNINRI